MANIKEVEEVLNRFAKRENAAYNKAMSASENGDKETQLRKARLSDYYRRRIDDAEQIIDMLDYEVKWDDDDHATVVPTNDRKWHVITDEMRCDEYHDGMPMTDCEVYITVVDDDGNTYTTLGKRTWRWVDDDGMCHKCWCDLFSDEVIYKGVIAWMYWDVPRPYEE